MTADDARTVHVSRVGPGGTTGSGLYRATNVRGAEIELGDGSSDHFTPVELLLVALAGCTALTAEPVVQRRADVERLDIDVSATKIRDDLGSRLVDLVLDIDAQFGPGDDGAGDEGAARRVLPDIVRQAEERLCTVSRTVAVGTPAEARIRPAVPPA